MNVEVRGGGRGSFIHKQSSSRRRRGAIYISYVLHLFFLPGGAGEILRDVRCVALANGVGDAEREARQPTPVHRTVEGLEVGGQFSLREGAIGYGLLEGDIGGVVDGDTAADVVQDVDPDGEFLAVVEGEGVDDGEVVFERESDGEVDAKGLREVVGVLEDAGDGESEAVLDAEGVLVCEGRGDARKLQLRREKKNQYTFSRMIDQAERGGGGAGGGGTS
eukprot:TRINITY_DN9572_c0_g2_i1.p1 TRINITY_DN9572_c0_g2~~TRINITY_DN9572_c0_g2_i1.p1  ORF type:complete len:220 (+),score=23.71 TRINITY_DN9572_c0_g2_i1:28-687(+)